MKLKSLHLHNIGAYYGDKNILDLSTSYDQNVILIGGKNGAGKTTILESIRLVLFGCLAYGFMTENEAYLKRIRTFFNRKAVENGATKFQIILYYEAVENFETINYILNRTWTLSPDTDKIRESFRVNRNGIELKDHEIDNFQNRLRVEIPPRLFELCLFDGEEISRIVSENRIPKYIHEASKVLFNLDLFENLEKDLETYKTFYIQKPVTTEDEQKKQKLEQKLSSQQGSLRSIYEKIERLNTESEQLKERLTLLKRDFEKHGGLIKEQRQKLVAEINAIENQRRTNSEKIRQFTQGLFPIYLVRHLLQDVDQQMEQEKMNESFEVVKSHLKQSHLKEILQQIYGEKQEHLHDEALNRIFSLLEGGNLIPIHRASFTQRSEVRALLLELTKIKPQDYIDLYDENAALLEDLQAKRKQLENHDQSSEFKVMLEEIERITQLIEQNKYQLEQLEEQESKLLDELKLTQSELDAINKKINEMKKSETSYIIAEKIARVSRRFREMQLRKKLDHVQAETVKMIQKLFRKKNFITKVHIDHETFQLALYHHQEELTKERLSAGEKEMLMLCLIWAMFYCSGRRLPFIFDTLLGRLDQDHKRQIIKHFIPNCGEQVLILSTDSEINTDQIEDLLPMVAKCYTLEYETSLREIKITEDQYFGVYPLELA